MKSKEECAGEISGVLVVRDVEPSRSNAAIRSLTFYFVKTRCCDKERGRRDLNKTKRTERTRFWANRG